MTFKIYNYFNFYVLNILLNYTQLKKKKKKQNKKQKTKKTKLRVKETNILKKKKFLTQVHPISKSEEKEAKLTLLK